MSFTNLNCENFGLTNPVTLTLDGNGVAIGATYNTTSRPRTPTAAPRRARPRRPRRAPCPIGFGCGERVPVGFGCGERVPVGFGCGERVSVGFRRGERVPVGLCPGERAPSPTASTGTHRHMNPRLFMPGSRFHL